MSAQADSRHALFLRPSGSVSLDWTQNYGVTRRSFENTPEISRQSDNGSFVALSESDSESVYESELAGGLTAPFYQGAALAVKTVYRLAVRYPNRSVEHFTFPTVAARATALLPLKRQPVDIRIEDERR